MHFTQECASVQFVGRVRRVVHRLLGGGTDAPPTESHSIGDYGGGPEARWLRLAASPTSYEPSAGFQDELARRWYRLNSVVRACVDELASSVAEPRLIVERRVPGGRNRWEEVERTSGPRNMAHRLQDLLANPCGDRKTSPYTFLEQSVSDLAIFGNYFAVMRRFESGRVGALQRVQPPLIEPDRRLTSDQGRVRQVFLRQYSTEYLVPDNVPQNRIVQTDDLLHWKRYEPLDEFWGLAPMISALRAGDLDDSSQDYIRAFFKNGGTPEGLLQMKGTVPPEERKAIQASWAEQHASMSKRFRIAVVDNETEFKETGTRPDKLKLDHVFDISESRICSCFQVPPILVGVRIGLMRSTDTNYKNARTSFWIETLSPMYENLAQILTTQIAWQFDGDGDLRVRFDLSGVRDLQESKTVLFDRSVKGYQDGVMTQNEARELIGLPPHQGGDHFHTRSSDGPAQKWDEEPKLAPKPAAGAAAPGPGAPRKSPARAGTAPSEGEHASPSSGADPVAPELTPEVIN